jgi:hypothetical protein
MHDDSVRRGYQDAQFEVSYAAGDVLDALLGFAEKQDRPQKLLVNLRRSGWHEVFLDAFLCFWHPLTEEEMNGVREDYEDVHTFNYGQIFGLEGVSVDSISCSSIDCASASMIVRLDAGAESLF